MPVSPPDASVVVPQNLAVAANYECFECITVALASQLVLSIDGPPGQQELQSLQALWNDLLEFGHHITAYNLDQITSQLDAFQDQIMDILGVGQGREVGQAYAFLLELRMEEGPKSPEEAEAALLAWWAERSS